MSTEGCGKVGLAVASPVMIGVGVGVLIGQGIMLCGELIEKHIERKAAEYAALAQAAREDTLAQVDILRGKLTVHTMASGSEQDAMLLEQSMVEQEMLRWSIEQARVATTNADSQLRSWRVAEREAMIAQLTFDLEFNRMHLSPRLIQEAEQAMKGSVETVRKAIAVIRKARQASEEQQTQEEAQRQQAHYLLQTVSRQLKSIDALLDEAANPASLEFIERRRTIDALVDAATAQTASNVTEAVKLATEARRVTEVFSAAVSTYLLDAWNSIHSEVNTFLGTLTALQKSVEEARLLQMADRQVLHDLTRRITSAYNDTQSLSQRTSLDVRHRLPMVAERVELLKQDVFAVIETAQQRSVAEAIAQTLTDCGFQSVNGEQSALQDNGDIMRVAMTQKQTTADGKRDDHLVTFDISRKGDVNYDFSGYTGASCVEMAQRIFTALRARGVYLLEPAMAEHLQEAYHEGVSPQLLHQPQFQLEPVKNKTQAELAERIHTVLERMQYQTIQQSAVGGSIELEAFNGSIGYHIILTPEGTTQVFKDAEHMDISSDPYDPVVAEAQQVVEQQNMPRQDTDVAGSKQRSVRTQKQNRRMLEY